MHSYRCVGPFVGIYVYASMRVALARLTQCAFPAVIAMATVSANNIRRQGWVAGSLHLISRRLMGFLYASSRPKPPCPLMPLQGLFAGRLGDSSLPHDLDELQGQIATP